MSSPHPSNNSELQLYRVLQRANLLQYFETFITQGGDDVQQLCEAGEDEFLEIMALVGMASKPLHVRRLQKALQEWVANPAAFEVMKKCPTHVMSMTGTSDTLSTPLERPNGPASAPPQEYKMTPPQSSTISTSTPWTSQPIGSPSEGSNLEHPSPSVSPGQEDYKEMMFAGDAYMMNMSQPALLEHQVTAIATAAALLAQDLPPFEPKSLPKKQISKEIQMVMSMSQDDPLRMDALRKYAAIYGRFDSKRKNDKPMSLHEISVNEAAAQLSSHFPALLTRREDLFPLARQVVRDSGYQYSKGHSRAAEVVIPPKSETADPESTPMTMSTPPSTSVTPRNYEKTFNDLQNELMEITLGLSEMTKEQDRIRSALRVLLETNDHEQMRALTAEMDVLNDRQTVMIKRRQSLVNTIAKYRKNVAKLTPPLGQTSNPRYPASLHAGGAVRMANGNNIPPVSNGSGIMKLNNNNSSTASFNRTYVHSLNEAPMPNSKDSLFEEGLRIATQYGMSDFAQELIGMKSVDKLDAPNTESNMAASDNSADGSRTVRSPSDRMCSSSVKPCAAVTITTDSLSLMAQDRSNSQTKSSSTIKGSAYPVFLSASQTPIPGIITTLSQNTNSNTNGSNWGERSSNSSPISSVCSDGYSKSVSIVAPSPQGLESSAITLPSDTKPLDTAIAVTTEITPGSKTTAITNRSGQVVEVETRRSSRKRNGEPDYYIFNGGGEKRGRSGAVRRSNSASSDLSSSSRVPSPSVSPHQVPSDSSKIDNIVKTDVDDLQTNKSFEFKTNRELSPSGSRSSIAEAPYPSDLNLRDSYLSEMGDNSRTENILNN